LEIFTLEQALVISRGSYLEGVQLVLESTVAIIFMGTPHAGSDIATWGKVLNCLWSIVRKTNKEILRNLEPSSEVLAELQQEFHTMLEGRRRQGKRFIELFCFFEELAVPLVGQEIVPKSSAILPAFPCQGIHANHMDMAKFSSRNDVGFRAVCDQLSVFLDDLANGSATSSQVSNTPMGATRHGVSPKRAHLAKLQEQEITSQTPNLHPQGAIQGHVYSGTVNSGGGPVFQGNQNVSGDFSFHFSRTPSR